MPSDVQLMSNFDRMQVLLEQIWLPRPTEAWLIATVKRVRSIAISGERFAELVDGSQLTQDGFARAAGMSRSWVASKSAPGSHRMDRAMLGKIAEFLRMPREDLVVALSPSPSVRVKLKRSSHIILTRKARKLGHKSLEDWLETMASQLSEGGRIVNRGTPSPEDPDMEASRARGPHPQHQ